MIPSSYPFFKKPEEMDQNIISEGTFIRIFAYITVNYSPNLLKTIALLLLRPEYVLVNLNCNRSSDFYDFCRRQSIVVRMRAHVVVPTICICIYLTVQLLFGWERF